MIRIIIRTRCPPVGVAVPLGLPLRYLLLVQSLRRPNGPRGRDPQDQQRHEVPQGLSAWRGPPRGRQKEGPIGTDSDGPTQPFHDLEGVRLQ